ncbi:MAG: molybdopterin-dependent oxidoreductase [bacterium]|nr:molybdopterin-dependent oxidoreductase [bacterium]
MKLKIDNLEFEVSEEMTLLDAAEQHGVYIPHLCSHPELTSYGGCRLCIVEVDGMRGYPTACTTKIKEGMTVRTESERVQEMRREILQLILSEHPSGCLICEESDECSDTMSSIRKVGVTTGCRWCSKDSDCELQRVVKYLEIKDIKFPVVYQDLDVEKYDPFFDRDYNLCIYCARCVRICAEHRKSFVLALNERGKDAFVGPAFHRTHVQAECEFCGACVSVCPTGALAEKNKKWAGAPDSYHESVCPFCSLNCDTQMLIKKGRIIGSLPPGDPHQSGGTLCVKGRFGLGETVNNPDRTLEPEFLFDEGYGIISMEDAFKVAAENLAKYSGRRSAFYISPNLTLEELAAANQFASKIIKTTNITSISITGNMVSYLKLAEKSVTIDEIEESGALVSIFLKGNYAYAPVTLAIKKAAGKGVPLCQIGWTKDTVSRFTNWDLAPEPGKEKAFFKKILNPLEKGKGGSKEIKDLLKTLESAAPVTFILGPGLIDLTEGKEIMEIIARIIELTGGKVFAPNPYSNLNGLLSLTESKFSEDIGKSVDEEKIDLLYIVGDAPFKKRPNVEFIVHQSSYPPPEALKANLILPAATWGEITGTYAGSHGKMKPFKAAVDPPGMAQGNCELFAGIAETMGIRDVSFSDETIATLIPAKLKPNYPEPGKKRKRIKVLLPDAYFPHILVQELTPHALHNASLSSIAAGLKELLPEATLLMNPEDAKKLNLCDCSVVDVESELNSGTYPIKVRESIEPGVIFLLTHSAPRDFETNPCPVHLRRKDV